MVEICKNLFIGNADDYEQNVREQEGWRVIHACKDPYHRKLLGYSGKGAPKDHPEYLKAIRGNCLFLNLVDAHDSKYIPKEIIDTAIQFIDASLKEERPCLVHCNLGESRSPSIGFLYLASKGLLKSKDFSEAEKEFKLIYPGYNPKSGIRGFIINNWDSYVK